MGAITVNRITNANIYVNGNSILGQAEECSSPELKYVMADHKALGMVGKVEFFSGIDKMEFKIKWSSFYADSLALFTDPFTPLSLQIRASAEVYTSAGRTDQIPVVIYLTCQNKGFPGASFKQHENADLESTLGATYMKVVMNGSDIIEFDVLANIFKVNGVDLLAGYKANIGG